MVSTSRQEESHAHCSQRLAELQEQETTQRQLEQERGRDLGRRSTEKLETLLEKHRELLEQQQELEAMMNVLFKGVFVHRYRDVVPDIRAICMEELGMWIRTCPESFLTDSYLKYIGWTLHDKHWEVRLCCVRALQGLYGDPQSAPRLELFTDRFRPRLVAMVQDKEPQVAVEVVKLLTLMAQNVEEFLSEEDCQGVYPAVFVASRALGSAAGTFLFHRLLDPQKHGNGVRDNQTFFRLLLTFFLESHIHEHAAYLVDSLWDCAGERLRDWDTATGLLLETGLQDRQEKALVEVLTCSALQCARGQPPVGRATSRKVSSRERKEQEEEKSRLSRSFIPVLPQLLEKFSADAHPVASLLTVLRHLELGLLCSARMERVLCQVLCQVREVFGKHSEQGVLDAASRALYALCDPELPLHARGDVTRGLLGDSLADRCHLQVTELLQAVAPDEEDIYGLAVTLRRISALFNSHNLTAWQLFDPCSQLLQHALDTGEVPAQVTAPALSCLFFHVLWELSRLHPPDVAQDKLRALHSQAPSHIPRPRPTFPALFPIPSPVPSVPSPVFQDQLHALRSRALSLCQLCQSCLSEPELELREQAFVVLCDLLVVLGPRLPHSGRESLFPLVLPLDESLQAQLGSFLMDRVFVSPAEGQPGHDGNGHPNPMGMFLSPRESQSELEAVESQLQALHRRRELLSGFSKLVLLQVLPPRAASDIFKHYVKFYEDFGDILKETLRRLRDMDLLEWARILLLSLKQDMDLLQGAQTLLLSLKQLQTELLLQEGPSLRGSQEFQGIRDLARRFSLFFGPHRAQTRPVLLALHREGIQFAFQEPPQPQFEEGSPLNLPFLEVLSEFSPRLQPPDRALILSFLEQTLREWGGVSGGLPAWPPLLTYRHSLSPPSGGETPPKPPRTKRPRLEAPPEPPSSSPWLSRPPLTSTALRPPPKNQGRPPSPPSLQSLTLMEEGGDEEEEEEGSNGDPPDQPGDPPKDLFDYALNSQFDAI
ncbi:cohesin subunit SA-3-like [Pithys albifrons albifrons]|uniref:cohesin subunit SA-3-like n=1 Tax=Pithys albifrons albifrons TaxID=3385563 RepID=UPI003A5CB573